MFLKLSNPLISTPKEDKSSKKKKVSVNFGIPKIETCLSLNKQDAKIDNEEFLEPLISTFPKSGFPPSIDIFPLYLDSN